MSDMATIQTDSSNNIVMQKVENMTPSYVVNEPNSWLSMMVGPMLLSAKAMAVKNTTLMPRLRPSGEKKVGNGLGLF